MRESSEKNALLLEIYLVFPQHFGFFQLSNITPAKEYGGNSELSLTVQGTEKKRWVKGGTEACRQQLRSPVQTRVQLLQTLSDVGNRVIHITQVSRVALNDLTAHFLGVSDCGIYGL